MPEPPDDSEWKPCPHVEQGGGLDSEVTNRIALDVTLGVPPGKSTVKYGPEELAWRKGVEEWQESLARSHPDALIDIREP